MKRFYIFLVILTALTSLTSTTLKRHWNQYATLNDSLVKNGPWYYSHNLLSTADSAVIKTYSGQYELGSKEGKWIATDSLSGHIERIDYYRNDVLNGICIEFHANGEIFAEFPYKNGLLEGTCNFYSRKGMIMGEYIFENDQLIEKNICATNSYFPPEYRHKLDFRQIAPGNGCEYWNIFMYICREPILECENNE